LLDTYHTGKIALRSALHVKRPRLHHRLVHLPLVGCLAWLVLIKSKTKTSQKQGKKSLSGTWPSLVFLHIKWSFLTGMTGVCVGGQALTSHHHIMRLMKYRNQRFHVMLAGAFQIFTLCRLVFAIPEILDGGVALLLTHFLRRGPVSVLGLQNQVYQISEFGGPEKTRAHAVTFSRVCHFCDQPLIVSPSAIVQMAV